MFFRRKTLTLLIVLVCVVFAADAAVAGITYGLKSKAPTGGISMPPTHLYYFEDNTIPGGSVTDVGAVKLNGSDIDADALAWSRNYGLLAFYQGASALSSTLISINPGTAVATSTGFSYLGKDIRGAVFDAADNLWVADAAGDDLLRINLGDGSVLETITLSLSGSTFNLSNCTDIAVASDGTFYLVSTYDVYTVDMGTGALTWQKYLGTSNALAGISFSTDGPDDIMFGYEVNGDDDLYMFDIDNNYSRTTFKTNIISSFNSGRGDLATIVIPAPGAILLGGIGVSVVGWLKRRRLL